MPPLRKYRYALWLFRDFSLRYTRFLIIGFITGFCLSFLFWQAYPWIYKQFFLPVDRIGIIGEFTPSTLPQSVQSLISGGLTALDNDGDVLPGLASWWEATDSGKLFTFHLRDDIVWHSGKKVTAYDVNYNIKNVDFTVVDTLTIKIKLISPYSPLPTLLAKPLFTRGLIGFGPYRVSRISFKGDKIDSLKLIPLAKSAHLKSKEYRFFRTENLGIIAFKLGEIDILEDISNPRDLLKWGNIKIYENIHYDQIVALFMNLKDQLIADKNMRQALAFALPVLSGERALSPISKMSWVYTDKVKRYDPDPVQVKKLLAVSKISTDSAVVTLNTFSSYIDIAQAISSSWNAAGIKTVVKVDNTLPDNYQVLLSAMDIPPDPDQYPFWHSTQTSTNISNYVNVKIDKLLEDGRQEMDPENRKKIYADFARRLVDDAPAIFLYYPKTYTILRK